MRRLLQDTLEDHIALKLLDSEYQKGDIIQIAVSKNNLTYTAATEAVAAPKAAVQG
jgi:hypothetical protein